MFTKETVTHRQNSYEFNWDLTPENVNALFHDLLCEYGEEKNPNMYYGRLYVGKVLADICVSSNYLDSPQRERPRTDKTKYILVRCYYILNGKTDSSEKIEGFNLWYNYASTKTYADCAESYEKKEKNLKAAIKNSLLNLYSNNSDYFHKEDKKDWEYVLSMKEGGMTEAEAAPAETEVTEQVRVDNSRDSRATTTDEWSISWETPAYYNTNNCTFNVSPDEFRAFTVPTNNIRIYTTTSNES